MGGIILLGPCRPDAAAAERSAPIHCRGPPGTPCRGPLLPIPAGPPAGALPVRELRPAVAALTHREERLASPGARTAARLRPSLSASFVCPAPSRRRRRGLLGAGPERRAQLATARGPGARGTRPGRGLPLDGGSRARSPPPLPRPLPARPPPSPPPAPSPFPPAPLGLGTSPRQRTSPSGPCLASQPSAALGSRRHLAPRPSASPAGQLPSATASDGQSPGPMPLDCSCLGNSRRLLEPPVWGGGRGQSQAPPAGLWLLASLDLGCWAMPTSREELMAGPGDPAAPMLFLALLLLLELSPAGSLGPGTPSRNLPENHIDLPGPALWMPPASQHRRRGLGKKERGPGLPSRAQSRDMVAATRQASRLPGAGGLLPGQNPAGLFQDKDLLLGLALPYPEKENRSPGSTRAKKRSREHRRRRERLKSHGGRALVRGPSSLMKKAVLSADQVLDQAPDVMEESSTSLAPTMFYLSTLEATPATEESLILPVTSLWPQAQPRPDGEVMPTLDMALFDWTDYEDLKPDTWPSVKKREKHRGKLSSDGNDTSPAEGAPCAHHQDCPPGSCCGLREHLCAPHNRGLNNKCFDDCMCVEGLRCYAKFHRNRRVTRRKGRCVEPETVSGDQGSFINV
ncbi:Draxin [Galemys pyrenaicus]|uniref:Draxin n=1 Tax=Galemys pyrenaicus TaxID=202257 RepID=A0A8J5ZEW2_GALPY|nr:Draxin [Galemys pyrenaicus]